MWHEHLSQRKNFDPILTQLFVLNETNQNLEYDQDNFLFNKLVDGLQSMLGVFFVSSQGQGKQIELALRIIAISDPFSSFFRYTMFYYYSSKIGSIDLVFFCHSNRDSRKRTIEYIS